MSQALPSGVAPNTMDNDTQRLRKMVTNTYTWGGLVGASNLEDINGTDNSTTLIRKLENNLYQIRLVAP